VHAKAKVLSMYRHSYVLDISGKRHAQAEEVVRKFWTIEIYV